MAFEKGHIPWNKGKEIKDETRKKLSDSLKGRKAWNKGKKLHYTVWNKGTKGLMKVNKTSFKRGELVNEKHPLWQEKPKYRALHSWVQRKKGRACRCEHCGLDKMPVDKKRWFQWANISRQYKRDVDDFIQLCIPCHKLFDKKHI